LPPASVIRNQDPTLKFVRKLLQNRNLTFMRFKSFCGGVEDCEQVERRVCLVVPQQDCKEVLSPVCHPRTRPQCKMVPREVCQPAPAPAPGRCRAKPSLQCGERPATRCGRTFVSECRTVAAPRCTDHKTEDCAMQCSPVYWCQVCDGV